jgi:hypothetical protein
MITITSTLIFEAIVTDFFYKDGDSLLHVVTVTAWLN